MSTQTQTLYIDTNGGVYCPNHVGYEAEAHLTNHPFAKSFTTGLTHWVRATEQDRADWLQAMDVPMPCFTCHFGH
jgi:hypothetical protein